MGASRAERGVGARMVCHEVVPDGVRVQGLDGDGDGERWRDVAVVTERRP